MTLDKPATSSESSSFQNEEAGFDGGLSIPSLTFYSHCSGLARYRRKGCTNLQQET